MSPSSLRVLAGAAAAVFVLLTAIAVGVVSRPEPCSSPSGPVASTAPGQPPSAAATSVPAGNGAPPSSSRFGPPLSTDKSTAAELTNPSRAANPAPSPAGAGAPSSGGAGNTAALDTCGRFGTRAAVIALFGAGLATVTAFALLLLAGATRTAPPVAPRPVSAPPAGGPRPGGDAAPRLDADRAALIRACIYVRDRVTSRALADRLAAAMSDAGVKVVEPVGERFDPSKHEAGGTTPTKDAKLAGTIAAVEVPGYSDRGGRVLRAPVVTVYQSPSATQRPARSRAEEDR